MNLYLALSNPDRIAIMNHLATHPVATNRDLSRIIHRTDSWTRMHLVMLEESGLITRTPDADKDAFTASVLNQIAPDVVWPIEGLTIKHCDVLAVPGRPAIMDLLARVEFATVGDVVKISGISQSQASKHLQALVGAGLVKREHRDRNSYWHSIADGIVWPVRVRKGKS